MTNDKILIVDDEPDMIAVYKKALTRAGFAVESAQNGIDAIRLAKETHPALILMDIKMPIMGGIEATSELLHDPAMKDVRIIFLTAFSDPDHLKIDTTMAKDLGAADFIKKGISLDEFVKKVRSYISTP